MINLNEYVERIWSAADEASKREAFTEMVNASHATKAKKLQTLKSIQSLTAQKLDSLAVNYAMAGEGLKVIK